MSKINFERTNRFVPAIATNAKLIAASTNKANDMLARSYFAHVDPDGNYVWPKIETAGYVPYLTLGENLAMDFTNAEGVVNAWMNSPTHRGNIVNEKFEDQGLSSIAGTYEPGHNTIMIVSLFGSLYKAKAQTAQTQPPAPTQTPAPAPKTVPAPVPAQPDASNTKVSVSKNVKITTISLSGRILVNVNTNIAGSPTMVTAKLKSQSISLLAGGVSGEYLGSFTFNEGEDFKNQTLIIEARDKSNVKSVLDYPVNIEQPMPAVSGIPTTASIPVTSDARMIKILRIIFGIFAAVYMIFLVIDAIIIRRLKINREGIHTRPHALLFLLITTVALFANW